MQRFLKTLALPNDPGFPVGSVVKNPPAVQEVWVRSLGQEDPWSRKWQPTPEFLLENSMDRGAGRATVHGVEKELDMT